jgi:S-(hydroxymethyl)glutathione dehydrogenase/alcohol dehydrogenase
VITKGAILWEPHAEWKIEEIDIGDPRAGEVKIRMEASGLCHSDYHLVTGAMPMTGFPVLGGHEGAGVVTEVGPGVTNVVPGDHVVLSFVPSCGQCRSCNEGHPYVCDLGAGLLAGASVADGSFRVQCRGKDVYPMCLLGTFAPYMVVHHTSVVKIDQRIPFEVACLVGCGVTTGYGSAVHNATVQPGEDVVIVGIGGVGTAALQGAVLAGARYVIAIDPVPFKQQQAKHFGATHAFSSMEEAIVPLLELTEGLMCHKVILTVGELQGAYIEQALTLTAKTGRCVVTAVADHREIDVKLNLFLFSMLQKGLQGSIFGGSNSKSEIRNILALYRAGRLNLDDMVTREYSLDQVNEGYRDMLAGKNIRGIIRYSDSDR